MHIFINIKPQKFIYMKKFVFLTTIILFLCFGQSISQDSLVYISAENIKDHSSASATSRMNLMPKMRAFSPTTDNKVFLDFVGTGDLQKSITEGSGIQANTSLGALYEKYGGDKKFIQSFSLEALINVATTADTIQAKFNPNGDLINSRNFGTYILNPVSAKQSFFLNWNTHFGSKVPDREILNKATKVISGINLRVISSNNLWNYADTTIANVSALSFRFGFFHEFIPDNYRIESSGEDKGKQKYSITWGVSYSFRGIYGDIKSSSYDGLRETFLGSKQVRFNGIETNFCIRLKNIRAEFQIPIFNGSKSVQGLTNTQFLFSIKFIGGIPLRIEKNEERDAEKNSEI